MRFSSFLFGSTRRQPALGVALLLSLACAPALLLVPGCGGGGSGSDGSGRLLSRSSGVVALNSTQTGTLDLRIFETGRGAGTFTVANVSTVTGAKVQPSQAGFRTGSYVVGGTFDASTNTINLTGSIPGLGFFTISANVPTASGAGSFTLSLNNQTFGPAPFTAFVTPTATATVTATQTATPTATTPAPNTTIPSPSRGVANASIEGSGNGLGSSSRRLEGSYTSLPSVSGGVQLSLTLIDNKNSNSNRRFEFAFLKPTNLAQGDTLTLGDAAGVNSGTLFYTSGNTAQASASLNAAHTQATPTATPTPGNSVQARATSGTVTIKTVTATNFTFTFNNLTFAPSNSGVPVFFKSGEGKATIS